MKTLVVLAALAAVATAGPTSRADTDFDDIKVEKRSPSFGGLHHQIPSPHHIQPVHHTYVQPIIPHHLGLKKPLIVSQPYGHHHHLFRSEEEQTEVHSAEAKESKKTCMKEMEAKCEDEITAKSSETDATTKTEDIDGIISDSDVAQSLRMAKEAVDTLQKKLQQAEKNPRMMQWKHGESETGSHMHENVETAKLALEHMQRNFGNLESMNVHARAFTNAEVHDANLKLESAHSANTDKLESPEIAFKNAADLKSEEERLAQWKDAIQNIQKNVELVRNIDDSFQHNTHPEKSAVLEKSSSLKQEIGDEHKQSGLEEDKTSNKHAADVKMAQNMDQISDHGKSIDSKNEMETSASELSVSKTTLHNDSEQKAVRSESTPVEKSSDIASVSKPQLVAEKMPISQPSLKSSGKLEMKNAEEDIATPVVDTTTFMKAAEHHQAEQHMEMKHDASNGHSSHDEHEMSSQLHQHKMSAEHHQAEHSPHMGHSISTQQEHQKLSSSSSHPKEALDTSLNLQLQKAEASKFLQPELISAVHGKEEHEAKVKLSDSTAGQSQLSVVAVKPADNEKLLQTFSHGSHGKSAEDGALFAPIEMNSAFKEALVPTKAWKDAHGMSRGAYGGSAALGGLGGSYGSGYGAGSGAVGVFPKAHVGGCAIPLLLSCSPNVVAGHLAKGHSYSYGASAYRTSENNNSHSKRDITKISRPAKLNRTPTSLGLQQKNILISDKL